MTLLSLMNTTYAIDSCINFLTNLAKRENVLVQAKTLNSMKACENVHSRELFHTTDLTLFYDLKTFKSNIEG